MQTTFIKPGDIKIDDSFWSPIMERVRTQVIPYQWEALNDRISGAEPSYAIRNFKLAAELTHPELDYAVPRTIGFGGMVFQDSDLAKWLEAAAYSLVWHPDASLEQKLDETIDILANAQQADGYMDTYYIINGIDKRWTNLKDHHELYCFGHFTEAAVAYFEATGKRKFLDIMIKYADCIDAHIGAEEGKIHGYPGHEIAEMALVRLYSVTKNEKHLKLAAYFINQRGQKGPTGKVFFQEEDERNANGFYWKDSYFQYQYYQAGIPVRDQKVAEGHAVRAVYLYSGMADVGRETNDKSLIEACERLFTDITRRQMYITAAIGQQPYGESFSFDYDLPNDTVYGETCASIGLAFFARRMAEIEPNAKYTNVIERALYNGIISGMSLDGTKFFYVNPLETLPESSKKDRRMHQVKIERQSWFPCACCPPNLARIIASLGTYVHSYNEETILTHLYISGEAAFKLAGKEMKVRVKTGIPWEGSVKITFEGEADFNYGFRIPDWCGNYTVQLNGSPCTPNVQNAYAFINRAWKTGDTIEIAFDMPASFMQANPKVRDDIGKAALQRGPIVYCLEEADNGKGLAKLAVNTVADAQVTWEQGLLCGVDTITVQGKEIKDWVAGEDDAESLYRPVKPSEYADKTLKFIPYYAWANRGPGEMAVWVHMC
ncbi:MAG: glycoside hydrolase family 127 protein [Spirochaetaceae bacterium]|jgi:DUF1680 family protein|nr:glycoside hydrolase family 127 protein [Spirochaetaceae bacterium]